MKVVRVYQAKNRFSELLIAAEQGEVVSTARRGVAVARRVAEPAARSGRAEARHRITASLARLRAWRDATPRRMRSRPGAGTRHIATRSTVCSPPRRACRACHYSSAFSTDAAMPAFGIGVLS